MKLKHNVIPKEFLNHIPRGMKYVMRNGKDFLVVEQVFCPNGHSLMVDNVRLHGEPSICVTLRVGRTEGRIYLDAFWGSHDKLYSFLPDSKATEPENSDLMCPACGMTLVTVMKKACTTCGSSQLAVLQLPGAQNRIMICAKLGCPWHRIVAEDIAHKYTEMVDDINYFGL
jgi:hypothetical protein